MQELLCPSFLVTKITGDAQVIDLVACRRWTFVCHSEIFLIFPKSCESHFMSCCWLTGFGKYEISEFFFFFHVSGGSMGGVHFEFAPRRLTIHVYQLKGCYIRHWISYGTLFHDVSHSNINSRFSGWNYTGNHQQLLWGHGIMMWLSLPNFSEVSLVCQTYWNHLPDRNPILPTDDNFLQVMASSPMAQFGNKVFANLRDELQRSVFPSCARSMSWARIASTGMCKMKTWCTVRRQWRQVILSWPVISSELPVKSDTWKFVGCSGERIYRGRLSCVFNEVTLTAAPVSIKMHWHAVPISSGKTHYIDPAIPGPCLSDIHNTRISFFEINVLHILF